MYIYIYIYFMPLCELSSKMSRSQRTVMYSGEDIKLNKTIMRV